MDIFFVEDAWFSLEPNISKDGFGEVVLRFSMWGFKLKLLASHKSLKELGQEGNLSRELKWFQTRVDRILYLPLANFFSFRIRFFQVYQMKMLIFSGKPLF